MNLQNKKILLGVTGGIAAYKSATLVRRLREQGAEVRIVMTEAAKHFITPLTLQAVSGHEVRDDLFGLEAENAMSHIELARWAELIVIAPASANIIARLACGLADNLLATLCLATETKVALAPAMNQKMWQNTLTQKNLSKLNEHGFLIWGPAAGDQACGEVGLGRMLEPEEIAARVATFFQPKRLAGKTVLITAGPTREAIDPVRYLSNHSSGKMGYALASAAKALGAEVVLISGPTSLTPPLGVYCVQVQTALEMQAAVKKHLPTTNIFIACAAVADYRPKTSCGHKLKKSGQDSLTIEMVANPDILAEVALSEKRPECVVGFAAETENLIENAKKKLKAKKLDVIVANLVGDNRGFAKDQNQVSIITRDDNVIDLPLLSKRELAVKIFNQIVN